MFKIPFFGKSKKHLGIDIGTFSVKVVELSRSKSGINLENYGERVNRVDEKDLENSIRKKAFFSSDQDVADHIREILTEAKISAKEAVFSIPDFMSFFTVFTAPPMPKEEIASVVRFEARQHIPLPLQEMALDWLLIDDEETKSNKKSGSKILLVAVPNKTILKYQKIADLAGIKLSTIEAEVFSLARSSINKEDTPKTVQLIDLGVQSTTITVSRNGGIRSTYSIDFSSSENVKHLAEALAVSYNEAEEIIKKEGLIGERSGAIMRPRMDILVSESKQVSDSFFRNEKKEVEKIILAGGAAQTPGLTEYFAKNTGKEVEIVNPFSNIIHPPILEEVIKEMGPRYSVAIGLALRGMDNKK